MPRNRPISPALDRELTSVSHQPKSSELRKLAEDNPGNRNYIRKCLNAWIEVNEIILEVKSKLAAIELVWDDAELQELHSRIKTRPSVTYDILKWYIRLRELAEILPELDDELSRIRINPNYTNVSKLLEETENKLRLKLQESEIYLSSPIIWPNPKNTIIKESSDFDLENVDITKDQEWNTIYSFPLYILWVDKTPENRRIWKSMCAHFLLDISEKYFKGFQLRDRMIISLFPSIIENSLDHSDGKTFFWIQITISPDESKLKLSFIVADEWDWIYEGIKRYLKKPELSFEKAYEIAFTNGWSSIWWKTNMWAWLDWMCRLSGVLNKSIWTKTEVSIFDHWREYKLDSPDRLESVETIFEVDPINKFRVVGNITVQK